MEKIKADRDSNMELARIIAMAMIVFRHFIFHGMWNGWPGPISSHGALCANEYILCLTLFLFSAGMNIFMLISGYYGIKLKWKGVIGFWLISIFYNALSLLFNGISGPMDIVNVFIISRSKHWFVKSYFLLMLMAPVLNAALDNLDLKHLRLSAICMFIICCISGWAFNNGTSNAMNVLYLICVYFIGGWLRRDDITSKISGKTGIIGYCLCAVLNFIGMLIIYYLLKKEIGIIYQNNNPITLVGACLLLCWFRNLKLKSRFVNTFASAMFGVLLISDLVFAGKLYPFIHASYVDGGARFPLIFALTYILTFAAGFAVEYLRKMISNPLSGKISGKMERISYRFLSQIKKHSDL